jgi:hypothetical protein
VWLSMYRTEGSKERERREIRRRAYTRLPVIVAQVEPHSNRTNLPDSDPCTRQIFTTTQHGLLAQSCWGCVQVEFFDARSDRGMLTLNLSTPVSRAACVEASELLIGFWSKQDGLQEETCSIQICLYTLRAYTVNQRSVRNE